MRLSVRVALRKREFRKFLKSLSLFFSLSTSARSGRDSLLFFSLFLSLRDCAIDFQSGEGVEETKVE